MGERERERATMGQRGGATETQNHQQLQANCQTRLVPASCCASPSAQGPRGPDRCSTPTVHPRQPAGSHLPATTKVSECMPLYKCQLVAAHAHKQLPSVTCIHTLNMWAPRPPPDKLQLNQVALQQATRNDRTMAPTRGKAKKKEPTQNIVQQQAQGFSQSRVP